jgi:hypothetical protein
MHCVAVTTIITTIIAVAAQGKSFDVRVLSVQYGTGSYVTVIEDRKLAVFPHILIKILARWEIVLTDDGQIPCTLEFPEKSLPDVHLSSSHTFNLMTLKVI